MTERIDHEIKIRVRASEYLALLHAAREDDRALSAYCRRVLVQHLERVSARHADAERDDAGQADTEPGHQDYPRAVRGRNA